MALARWYKIDFHTHTPASKCFKDKSITAVEWLKAAKQSGLNSVVVTDHNSVGFIREIEKEKHNFEDEGFKVFYGIELCVSAEFTHILVIFNNRLSVTQIEDAIIRDLGLKRDNWSDTEINVTEDQLKNLCKEIRNDIFVIPAHFGSNKGLGEANINAIKRYQDFLCFDAIEVRTEKDVSEYNNKLNNKVINSAALITGSDNPSDRDEAEHSIEGFGKKFTWMKMSSISFEGMRQVFIDPEHRCINWLQLKEIGLDFNPNEVSYNYISGIEINGVPHLSDNMSMRFSPHLNCIVGGRGTGKSTIVQAINHGLDKLLKSDNNIISKTIDNDGEIKTFFEFGTNKSYIVQTKKDNKKWKYICLDENGLVENPPEFKVDYYGQKEIFELVENENNTTDAGNSPLVKMIDRRMDVELYEISDKIEKSLSGLISLAELYRTNCRKIGELPNIKAEIEKSEAILRKFKASGIEEARKKYDAVFSNVNKCKNVVEDYKYYLKSLYDELENKIQFVNGIRFDLEDEDIDFYHLFLKKMEQSYLKIQEFILKQQDGAKIIECELQNSDVCKELEKTKEVYLNALEQVKNTGSENIQHIQDKLQKYRNLEKELMELQNGQITLKNTIQRAINQFIDNRLELSRKRQEVVDSLNLKNVRITIYPLAHITRWKQLLQREMGKEGTYEKDYQHFADAILEDGDFLKYKEYLYFLITSEDGDISKITNKSFDARFLRIWEDKQKNDTLSALVKVIPEDYVDIKIIEESREIDINEGSPGQKSAAILAFVLSSGNNPLIIDQPEDDLDNSLIYSLIVKSIRTMKNKRQIIIVTHNPNIPVLGDAEGIIILERNKDGKVTFRKNKKAGCIEEKLIRDGICDIMEGGENAFRKREEKYLYLR